MKYMVQCIGMAYGSAALKPAILWKPRSPTMLPMIIGCGTTSYGKPWTKLGSTSPSSTPKYV